MSEDAPETEEEINRRHAEKAAKRKAARDAKADGKKPSEVGATTGASQQREHLTNQADHPEKIATRSEGKQGATQDQREPELPVDQIQDDTPIDEEPLYVNAKQYYRILKRRVARARLEEVHRLSRQRKVRHRCHSNRFSLNSSSSPIFTNRATNMLCVVLVAPVAVFSHRKRSQRKKQHSPWMRVRPLPLPKMATMTTMLSTPIMVWMVMQKWQWSVRSMSIKLPPLPPPFNMSSSCTDPIPLCSQIFSLVPSSKSKHNLNNRR